MKKKMKAKAIIIRVGFRFGRICNTNSLKMIIFETKSTKNIFGGIGSGKIGIGINMQAYIPGVLY